MIYLPKKSDGETSEIICQVAYNNPRAELFWHMDNSFIGMTSDIHQIKLLPSSGYHKLSVFDNLGNKKSVEIIIK